MKPTNAQYDYIIAGGGAAGLGLAYQMARSALRGKNILIVDREAKDRNDHTWCFWIAQPTPLDHLIYRSWERIEVCNHQERIEIPLAPYRYNMIRGIDYYRAMQETLHGVPGVTFAQARVTDVSDARDASAAQVMMDQQPFAATYAFDSRFQPIDYFTGPAGYHYLKQHFRGWDIETPTDCFDPQTVTMFDFRTPQDGCMRFFYILPFTKRRALVEYTLFSAELLKGHQYDRAISEYLENVRGISQYRVEAVETGIIPMTDRPFPRRLGKRVMAVGTKGGLVKASSGYAFLRIQKDAAAIVRSLVDTGSPFHVPASPWRYRMFDTVMLQVMYRNGDRMADIFMQLFRNNRVQNIFRFLDESASWWENLRLLASLPIAPFLKALFRVKLLRKV